MLKEKELININSTLILAMFISPIFYAYTSVFSYSSYFFTNALYLENKNILLTGSKNIVS